MSEEECTLRRRCPSVEGARMTLNLDTGSRIHEGEPKFGTPTPSTASVKFVSTSDHGASTSLAELRKKQQSFEIQIEDCDEEVICTDSDDEAEVDANAERAPTPIPQQDYSPNVLYKEGPQAEEFLKALQPDHECYTDISDTESDGNGE